MQAAARECTSARSAKRPPPHFPTATPPQPTRPRADLYQRVFDSRRRRVRGLWQRNDRFYANLTIADDLGKKTSRFVPLNAASLTEAIEDYRRLQVERGEDRLRPIGMVPELGQYVEATYAETLRNTGKREASIRKEAGHLQHWCKRIGHLRLNKIRPFHLAAVLTGLTKDGLSGRTVNLYLISIRSVLKAARRDGHIKPPLPFEGLDWQKVDNKARRLFTADEVDQLCDVVLQASKNGRQVVDYIRFLQFSGARFRETLSVRWQDVDFERGHVIIGAEGESKNRRPRAVDLNPQLEAHLRDMAARRQPDSDWLFPSPQRGDRDIHAQSFRETLYLACKASGVICRDCRRRAIAPETTLECSHCGSSRVDFEERLLSPALQAIRFHDLRHHFISYAVMAGIDFMTIAKWAGHQDGGVLIGKVYGHLADEHRKRQAARLSFGPSVVSTLPLSATPRTRETAA